MDISNNDPRIIFGRNFAFLLQRNNLSYKEAASLIGMYRQRIPKIIGGSQNFKLETVIKVSETFNVAPFLLFTRLFDIEEYRTICTFSKADYMGVIRNNLDKRKIGNVDLNRTVLSQITSIHGARSNPTIETLIKIADGTDSTLSELLQSPDDKIKIHIAEGGTK